MTCRHRPAVAPRNDDDHALVRRRGNASGTGSTEGFAVHREIATNSIRECDYPDVGGLWNQVAPIESTGTWLRRGFWYAETDAVVFNRIWDRNDKRLAAQDVNVNLPPVNNQSLGFNPIFLDTNRLLILNGSLAGTRCFRADHVGTFPVPRFAQSRP